MFSVLRSRLSYANVGATLALVFAMSGGALAASKFLITSTKQIKPSVLAQLKGKAGKNGGPGAAGPAGTVGPAGPAGQAGAKGEAGAAGPAGPQGPVGSQGPTGATGKEGKAGPQGEPWTAGGTLPEGAEETGTWVLSKLPKELGNGQLKIPISFTIPLAASLDEEHVHLISSEAGKEGEEPVPPGCTLTRSGVEEATVEVDAEPGNLCVYARFEEGITTPLLVNIEDGELGAGRTGAVISAGLASEGALAQGYWAVRAS